MSLLPTIILGGGRKFHLPFGVLMFFRGGLGLGPGVGHILGWDPGLDDLWGWLMRMVTSTIVHLSIPITKIRFVVVDVPVFEPLVVELGLDPFCLNLPPFAHIHYRRILRLVQFLPVGLLFLLHIIQNFKLVFELLDLELFLSILLLNELVHGPQFLGDPRRSR